MTVADLLKLKYPNRGASEEFQIAEYRRVMGRYPSGPVAMELTLTSGTRRLTLTGDKPPKVGLLKAFIR